MKINKKIFIVDEHASSKQNGVGTFMMSIISCMKSLDGVDLNLISFNSDEKDFTICEEDGCRHYRFPICNGGSMLDIGGLFWPLLRMYVDDVAENVFFVNHSPCVDLLKTLRENYRKARVVFTIHDQGWTASLLGNKVKLREVVSKSFPNKERYKTERFCKKYFQQERKMYNFVDDVVCLSRTTRALLCDTYKIPLSKVHLIPNGYCSDTANGEILDKSEVRKELGIRPEEKLLIFVGRTTVAKGIDELLKAFDNLCMKHENLHLVIAGEVFRFNEFSKLTRHSASRITYTGLIPKDLLNKWYAAADIGVIPSFTEQCSYTGMEMMAKGLLIVTTDGNGLTDMFRADYNAIVAKIEPNLSENFEKALESALQLDETKRKQICRNAQDCVQRQYSLAAMRERYRKLLTNEPENPAI